MRISLQRILKDADERVRQACAKVLNQSAKELEAQIKSNMSAQGIQSRSGRLRASVTATTATANKPSVVVRSEVYAKLPKRPGKNRRLWGKGSIRYPSKGVAYGRILEFSPRYNKPFFYPAWYKLKNQIKEDIIDEVGKAWSGK